MTAMRGYVPATDRPGLGVHSLDHLCSPCLILRRRSPSFSSGFWSRRRGERRRAQAQDLRPGSMLGNHRRGQTQEIAPPLVRLFRDDLPYLQDAPKPTAASRSTRRRVLPATASGCAIRRVCSWRSRSPPKPRPLTRRPGFRRSSPAGIAGAPVRAKAPMVRPRRLSHILVFTPHIDQAVAFYSNIVGLRLSDRSDRVAFMHAIHGSDHHILASPNRSARPTPLQLRYERDRRHRAWRHAHGRQRPYRGLGSRPSRARLELFPLRAGPLGQLRRIFLRHRLHPGGAALESRSSPAGRIDSSCGVRSRPPISPSIARPNDSALTQINFEIGADDKLATTRRPV